MTDPDEEVPAVGPRQPLRLLALPAELKNEIYRYAMLEEHPIRITINGYERSGLLATCKQVREEAIKIFYYENRFHIMKPRYSSAAVAKWYTLLRRLDLKMDTRPTWEVKQFPSDCAVTHTASRGHFPDDAPHWQNYLESLRLTHSGVTGEMNHDMREVFLHSNRDPARLLRFSMRMQVREMRSQPWTFVERMMTMQRAVLACSDVRWWEDYEIGGEEIINADA